MAILLNGLTPARARPLDRRDDRLGRAARPVRRSPGRPTDKHSTGGVGDKITLPLAPLVAACGAAVPQLSGRGLGHTGGTLDKLESIPGWRASVSNAEFLRAARRRRRGDLRGRRRAGAGRPQALRAARRHRHGRVDPADRVSSIMSKKIAEGTRALVLDVKVGTGAFMKTAERRARAGRRRWSALGTAHGVRTVALLTDMSTPLGPHRRQRARGRRVGRGARRRRARRRRRADRSRWPARCSPRAGHRRRRPGRRAARRPGDGRLAAR